MFVLPEKVKMGTIKYTVRTAQRVADEQSFGKIILTEDAIELHPGLSPERQKVVLFHEFIHHWIDEAGLEHDEQFIKVVSSGFARLIDENPGVFA